MNPPQRPTTPKLQGPRPAPLKLSKNSIKIKKPPPHPLRHNPPPPQQHFHHPVVIYTVSSVNEFMSLIQRLTGPSSSPPAARHGFPLLSLSPAMDSRPTPHRPFLQKHPSCFICNADEMDVDDVVSDPNSSSPFSNLRQTGSYLMVTASGNQASTSIHCRRRPSSSSSARPSHERHRHRHRRPLCSNPSFSAFSLHRHRRLLPHRLRHHGSLRESRERNARKHREGRIEEKERRKEEERTENKKEREKERERTKERTKKTKK